MRKHLVLFSLLIFTSLATRTQQAAPNADKLTTNQAGVPTLTLTSDGVRACAKVGFSSLPDGVYWVGGNVLPPKPKSTPKTTLSDEALQYAKQQHVANFEATSVVGLTVDVNGEPQDICVLKEAGYGLDRKAFEAVAKYRFKPATLNGTPVPVRIAINVNFRPF